MVKVMVNEEAYKLCEKCGIHRKPDAFKVKGRNRKACSSCRGNK